MEGDLGKQLNKKVEGKELQSNLEKLEEKKLIYKEVIARAYAIIEEKEKIEGIETVAAIKEYLSYLGKNALVRYYGEKNDFKKASDREWKKIKKIFPFLDILVRGTDEEIEFKRRQLPVFGLYDYNTGFAEKILVSIESAVGLDKKPFDALESLSWSLATEFGIDFLNFHTSKLSS